MIGMFNSVYGLRVRNKVSCILYLVYSKMPKMIVYHIVYESNK